MESALVVLAVVCTESPKPRTPWQGILVAPAQNCPQASAAQALADRSAPLGVHCSRPWSFQGLFPLETLSDCSCTEELHGRNSFESPRQGARSCREGDGATAMVQRARGDQIRKRVAGASSVGARQSQTPLCRCGLRCVQSRIWCENQQRGNTSSGGTIGASAGNRVPGVQPTSAAAPPRRTPSRPQPVGTQAEQGNPTCAEGKTLAPN